MFANRLIAPFAILGAVFLGLAWTTDESWAVYFVPCLVVAALIFILSPQINWWWYSKNPPELSEPLQVFLGRMPFYRSLSATEQRRFRGRIALFNMGVDWEPLAFPEDNLPPDVQVAIATPAVMLTFYREKFLFDQFEKVLVFPRPFPTPEHPYNHTSEMHQADGCLLFSAEQVMLAAAQPGQRYNVAMHEYAKVFMLQYPQEPWPILDPETSWSKLEQVSGMSRAYVESVIGLAGVDALPVAVHHYFYFPERFAAVFPEVYTTFRGIFASKL